MKRLKTIFLGLILTMSVNAQDGRFAITLRVDSAIASESQKVYLYSQIEKQMHLHDSLNIDSVHRVGTLHGSVPYEYAVHLMFARRGPGVVPVVVKNGDSITVHVGDEDDGFRLRYPRNTDGSPAMHEYVNYYLMQDSLDHQRTKVWLQMQLVGLPETKKDSLKTHYDVLVREIEHSKELFAMNARYPYAAMGVGGSIYSNYKWSPTTHTYKEEVVDSIMNSLIQRFPDYPPIRALVNDSTLGDYMSAESFATNTLLWKRYSSRFYDSELDTIVRPLKVGDYFNILGLNEYRGQYVYVDFWASWCQPCLMQMPNIKQAAQMFSKDLMVHLISIDKSGKEWWSAVKEHDLRNHLEGEQPYQIHNRRAYDEKGKMNADVRSLGIKTIPHNYLIDRSGRIIAKNISGAMLIDKMQQLLEKEKQQ
jgi:thiol-disulfide isomerase/thioredoxin